MSRKLDKKVGWGCLILLLAFWCYVAIATSGGKSNGDDGGDTYTYTR